MRLTPSDIKLILRNKESLSEKLDFLTDVQLETEHDFDVLKDEYLRIEEELTGLRGQLEKQTNARKSEETARMYYVEQVNKLREALGVFARLKAQKRDGFKDADSFLLEISANRARLALEGKEA